MTFCGKLLASQNARGRKVRARMPQDPCHLQARCHRRPRLQTSLVSHHQRRTISLLLPPNKTNKTPTSAACVYPNSSPAKHHLHHQNLSHTSSLHHLLCQMMFLRLRLHLLRPPLVHLAPHRQPAPPSLITPQSQHHQFATPMPQSPHRLFATNNPPPNPLTQTLSPPSAPPSAPR